jgi:hypothetical protein
MRCVECGAPVAAVTQVCAECGSPAAGQRPAAADPAAGPSDDLETAQAPARTARRPSAWIVRGENGGLLEVDLRPALAPAARWLSAWIRRGQWYFLICLVLFLVLFVIGVAVLNYAAPYGLHRVMGGFIVVGVSGALLFLGLFEAARPQFHYRQILWALVVVLSTGVFAPVPLFWLALVRRRGRDWLVFAVYLAAWLAFLSFDLESDSANMTVIQAYLLVFATLHTVLAFSPTAAPATFREAKAARAAGEHQEPVTEAVAPEDPRRHAAGLNSRSGPRMRCVECGAPVAAVTQVCAECGAPAAGQR